MHGSCRSAYGHMNRDTARATFESQGFRVGHFGHWHEPRVYPYQCRPEDSPGLSDRIAMVLTGSFPVTPRDRTARVLCSPGSVGQPRDGDPRAAYGVFDDESGLIQLCRIEYDVVGVPKEIEVNGLPGSMARPLAFGI